MNYERVFSSYDRLSKALSAPASTFLQRFNVIIRRTFGDRDLGDINVEVSHSTLNFHYEGERIACSASFLPDQISEKILVKVSCIENREASQSNYQHKREINLDEFPEYFNTLYIKFESFRNSSLQ